MTALSKKNWIGVDFTEEPPVIATASAYASGGHCIPGLSAIKDVRPCGCRTAVAISTDRLFVEKLEILGASRFNAAKLVAGQLDIRLPVPVEECIVSSLADKSAKSPSFVAFALPQKKFDEELSTVEARLGVSPECVLPEPAVLWNKVVSETSAASRSGCLFHLHAAKYAWTIVAGTGGRLESAVAIAPGDTASVNRNISILALRMMCQNVLLTLSGSQADAELVAALTTQHCAVTLMPALREFMAVAIAESGALSESHDVCSFRSGDREHKAAVNRARCIDIVFAGLLIVAGIVALCLSLCYRNAHLENMRDASRRIVGAASAIAGSDLSVNCEIAPKISSDLFEARLNQAVDAFGDKDAFLGIALSFEATSGRGLTFSSIKVENHKIRFTGRAGSTGDFSRWRNLAREHGWELAYEANGTAADGSIYFSATLLDSSALPEAEP